MGKHDKPKQPTPPTTPARAQEPALTTQTLDVGLRTPGDVPVSNVEAAAMRQSAEAMLPATEEKRGPSEAEAREALLDSLLSVLQHEARSDGKDKEAPLDTLKRRLGLLERFETLLGNGLREWVETAPDNAVPFTWTPHEARALQDKCERLDLDIRSVNHALEFDAKMPPEKHGDEDERVRTLAKKVLELEAQLQPAHNAFRLAGLARGILVSHVKDSAKDYDTGGRYRVATVTVTDGEVVLAEMVEVKGGSTTSELTFGQANDRVQKLVDDFLTPGAHRS